jgi:hypothetical protein
MEKNPTQKSFKNKIKIGCPRTKEFFWGGITPKTKY